MDYGIMIVNDAGNPFITPQSVPISLYSKGSANSVKLSSGNSSATVTLPRPNNWGAVIPFAYTTQPCALKASVDANNNLVVTAINILAASFTLSVFSFTEFTPTLPDYGFASWNAAGDLVFTNEMKVLTDVQTLGNPASVSSSQNINSFYRIISGVIMSAGTLTLTNNSAAVSGSGTAFTTELAAGDFAVVTVGGIPYTLPVKTVNSNTSLTLVSNFTGPTQSGTAWYAVPRIAMNLVTAAAVTQAAEALRGLNYDKQNWQNIFSGTGNVTVKLPDGSIWTGPAWNGIASTVSGKMDKSKNLDDVNDKNESRKNLGLGSAATRNVGIETGNVIIVGGFGIGTFTPESVGSASTTYATDLSGKPPGIYRTATGTTPDGLNRNGVIEKYSYSTSLSTLLFITTDTSTPKAFMQQVSGSGAGSWAEFYTTINTTKASDGTIKAASPIVQIFHDGRCQLSEESEGCTVARLATGEYLVEGCMGLNADGAWGGIDGGFDIPKDRNGQPLVWLDYDVNPDGSVLVKTFHRTYRDSPAFARNLIGIKDDAGNVIEETVKNGDPIDIPTDQYVSVRVEMPSDSLWNKRQEEAREAMKKAEREQTPLDAQS